MRRSLRDLNPGLARQRWSRSLPHPGSESKGRGMTDLHIRIPKEKDKMKKDIRAFALIAMALTLTFSATSPELQATQKTPPRKTEQHSDIQRAVNDLQRAKAYLTLANHDFGGHRDDAVKAVEEAMKQLKLAEQFDKK